MASMNYPLAPSILNNGPLYSPPPNATLSISSNQNGLTSAHGLRLSNGSLAYCQQLQATKRSHLRISLPIGPGFNGPRTLLPEILLAGSPVVKARVEQASTQGIQAEVSAAGDSLILQITAPSGVEAAMANMALQLLTQPQVDLWTFKTQREDLLNNLSDAQALPETRLDDLVTQTLYGPYHPYSETTDRVMRQVQVQTPLTVLQTLQQAMAQPASVSLNMISASPISAQQAILENALKQYQWFPKTTAILPQSPPVLTQPAGVKPILLADNKVSRAHITVAWRAPNVQDVDYPTFLVLLSILDGFSGRFFKQLRTRQGLVYSTNQSYENYLRAAEYRLKTEVDIDKIAPALEGIQKVLEGDLENPGILSHYISERELVRAKKSFILSIRSAIQSAKGLADFNEPMLLAGISPLEPEALIERIQHVSAIDLQRVAQRVFGVGGFRVTAIVAPEKSLIGLKKR